MNLIDTFPSHDDESGLGYHRRLASQNCLSGWRELATMAAITSRDGLFAIPERTASIFGLEIDWVRRACEQERSLRNWGALHRVSTDAVCTDCLRENPYLRQAWEHTFSTACPRHCVQLIDHCPACSEPLENSRGLIEFCPCGHDLRTTASKPARPAQVWLSALIASAGGTSGGVMPIVTGVSVQEVCELARVLCLWPDPSVPSSRKNGARARTVEASISFLAPLEFLLADWPTNFESHVAHRIQVGRAEARTLSSRLGTWYAQLKKVCKGATLEIFLRTVIETAVATFDGAILLDDAAAIASELSAYLVVDQAAKELGVGRDALTDLIKAGGCEHRARRLGTKGVVYEVPRGEIDRIAAQRQRWISEGSACEGAGVTPAVLERLMSAGVIESDLKWRSDLLKSGPVEAMSVQTLRDRINAAATPRARKARECLTIAELTSRRMGDNVAIETAMRAMADGRITAVARGRRLGQIEFLKIDVAQYFGTPLLEEGMSIQELAEATGWKWESISHWISAGYMEASEIMRRGQRCHVISPRQLLSFRHAYVPLADLARALNTKASSLSLKLGSIEIVGAKPTAVGSARGGLLRIADLGRMALVGAAATTDGASLFGSTCPGCAGQAGIAA